MPRYSDLKRRPHKGNPWPVYWFDPHAGELLTPRGETVKSAWGNDASRMLSYITSREGEHCRAVVYLSVGEYAEDPTCPQSDWYNAAALDRWHVEYRAGSPAHRSAICQRDGDRVDLRHTATWYGGCRDLPRMRSAHQALTRRLARDFGANGDSIFLYGTPAQTGLMLLDVSLPLDRYGQPHVYPVLDEEMREFVEKIGYQHRQEFRPFTAQAYLPGISVWDARLAYAAFLRDLPVGEPVHDRGPFVAYRPGWYCVTITPPVNWSHVGPARDLLVSSATGKHYPTDRAFKTWLSEPELRYLRTLPGWQATLHERLIWPARTDGDPLREWGDRLIKAFYEADALPDPVLRQLLSMALRSILLDTLGSFKRSVARRVETIPYGDPIAAGTVIDAGPYGQLVEIPVAISNDRMRYAQPHWIAHIWARQHASLAQYVHSTFGGVEVLGLKTDGAYIARHFPPNAELLAPVRIGKYRCKGTMDGPLATPQDWRQLAELAELSEISLSAYRDAFDAEFGEERGF